MSQPLQPIEVVMLAVAYSVPDRTYRVPSCRRKYAQGLADRDPPLAHYDKDRRKMVLTDDGTKALLEARKMLA